MNQNVHHRKSKNTKRLNRVHRFIRSLLGVIAFGSALLYAGATHAQPPATLPSVPSGSLSSPPSSSPTNQPSTIAAPTLGASQPSTAQPINASSSAAPATSGSGSGLTGTAGTSGGNVPSVPSIETLRQSDTSGAAASATGVKTPGKLDLPNGSGQYWVEYDIRPYCQALKGVDRPQQAVIDWIVRETGSDVWFNEPMGILTADRSTLRVYHNAGMQKVVAQVYERFVNGNNTPQVFGIKLVAIGNPNWRSKALPLMRSAPSRTPGVQAWLMSKENAAIFMAQLRQRQDAREIQSADVNMVHGQSQNLEQLRSRNFLKEYLPNTTSPYPPVTPSYGEIQEGYRMVFSPLLSLDGKTLDVMFKCDIDQVEKLNTVPIDSPTPGVTMQVEVPQLVSWRLHERFRWPTDQVLVLSCGVVAAPTGNVQNTLLTGGAPNILGLNRIIPNISSQRNDALLILEYKGSGSASVSQPVTPTGAQGGAASVPNLGNASGVSRGRY